MVCLTTRALENSQSLVGGKRNPNAESQQAEPAVASSEIASYGANPCCRIDDIIHFRREFPEYAGKVSIVDLMRSGNVYGSYLIKTRSQAGLMP